MVTTESRTAATTSGRSGVVTLFDAVATVWPAAPLGDALAGAASGPVTRAAVPPAATTAARTAAATIVAAPRDRGRSPRGDGVGPGTGVEVGAAALGPGEAPAGVSGSNIGPRSVSNITAPVVLGVANDGPPANTRPLRTA